MKILIALVMVILLANVHSSCKSSHGAKSLCDTACLKDTVKFSGNHVLKPYVYITARNCRPDSIVWSYEGLGANRKIDFEYPDVNVNKGFIHCLFRDTAYVYLLFNDCVTRRGYQVKLPFGKSINMNKKSSGINGIDPKFAVADNMIAYTDRGNIYVEEVSSGKTAMMTFGKPLDMNYDAIHETLDSVNLSPTRIWVKVKIDNKWQELEKAITLSSNY